VPHLKKMERIPIQKLAWKKSEMNEWWATIRLILKLIFNKND
jgi:hypothetical protein